MSSLSLSDDRAKLFLKLEQQFKKQLGIRPVLFYTKQLVEISTQANKYHIKESDFRYRANDTFDFVYTCRTNLYKNIVEIVPKLRQLIQDQTKHDFSLLHPSIPMRSILHHAKQILSLTEKSGEKLKKMLDKKTRPSWLTTNVLTFGDAVRHEKKRITLVITSNNKPFVLELSPTSGKILAKWKTDDTVIGRTLQNWMVDTDYDISTIMIDEFLDTKAHTFLFQEAKTLINGKVESCRFILPKNIFDLWKQFQ
jgi:hypothetical protein